MLPGRFHWIEIGPLIQSGAAFAVVRELSSLNEGTLHLQWRADRDPTDLLCEGARSTPPARSRY